jgi:hypothetical protein
MPQFTERKNRFANKITLAPNHGGSDTPIRVSGTDFTPGGMVKISFIVTEESLVIIRTLETTVVVSSNGTFSVTITALGLLEDVNSIVVVDVRPMRRRLLRFSQMMATAS